MIINYIIAISDGSIDWTLELYWKHIQNLTCPFVITTINRLTYIPNVKNQNKNLMLVHKYKHSTYHIVRIVLYIM